MIIATLGGFLGSLWFAGLAAVVGYIAGNLYPLSKFKGGSK